MRKAPESWLLASSRIPGNAASIWRQPLAYSDSTFEQQATNLVDDCCASHHPALSYSMPGLQIQLVIALDRYEAHLRPPHCFRNRFSINVVALVRLYIRLYILRRHQPYLMTCSLRARPRKCDPPQASMPINSTCRFAVKSNSCLRENFLRTTT